MKDGTPASLDAELAKLARDVSPPRDLWPGVLSGIVRTPRAAPSQHRTAIWMAYAASAAGLCLAAALAWVIVQRGAPLSAGGPTAAHFAPKLAPGLAPSFGDPRDPKYVAARAELESTFQQRLAQLDPATRAQIEADLATIRKAREDISKALAAQPDCPVLEQLLASALHDEFDLYQNVVRTTQPSTARI
ncbi:MAG TPA: hypothetical protein VHY75_12845 [Steroidobacteraceae bacterium]|jgi:hypothetical protein|nr:hypothetical protein [Steroidobacteraceae bacterium]